MSILHLTGFDGDTTHALWSWTAPTPTPTPAPAAPRTARVLRQLHPRVYLALLDGAARVALKVARGPAEMDALAREAALYAGAAGPRVHGAWRGRVGRADVGCLVLEYGAGGAPPGSDGQMVLACWRVHGHRADVPCAPAHAEGACGCAEVRLLERMYGAVAKAVGGLGEGDEESEGSEGH